MKEELARLAQHHQELALQVELEPQLVPVAAELLVLHPVQDVDDVVVLVKQKLLLQ